LTVIDAHHHLWDPARRPQKWLSAYPALQRAFGIEGYRAASASEPVAASVLVQVLADTSETEEFLELADRGTVVAAVVGWADLTGPDVAAEIARLRGRPGGGRLAGIRHLVQDEPDPGWLDRPAVRRGIRAVGAAGLTYDLLVRPSQLNAAARLASDLDSVHFVLDHGGKPAIASGQFEPWASQLAELARRPNVTCKLSGLVTEAGLDWDAGQIAPYVHWLLDCFGPGRLIFGSDWPVCTVAASYAQVAGLARTLLSDSLSAAELDLVFVRNATTAYGVLARRD
jgi:L-fuconolactonase